MARPPHRSHPTEYHTSHAGPQLNRIRAAVLGADDGIVSVSGLVVGVASATKSTSIIFAAGMAGLIAGALSMAAGEYVSVSSQRDSERAMLAKERYELKHYPEAELEELAALYEQKGLSPATARLAAKELTAKNAQRAHFDAELGIDPDALTDPWQAAVASAISFTLGAALPMLTINLLPSGSRIPITFGVVIVALAVTGALGARIGGAKAGRAAWRVVAGGALAMIITFAIGRLFHVS